MKSRKRKNPAWVILTNSLAEKLSTDNVKIDPTESTTENNNVQHVKTRASTTQVKKTPQEKHE